VSSLATEVFGDALAPRVKKERTWYQVYLPATRRLTHGVRNPLAAWLDELGAFGYRAWEKSVPAAVFAQPASGVATFLRHLWATDGTIRAEGVYPAVRYDSSSERLSQDVQALLLRIGVNARVARVSMGSKGRASHRVTLSGKDDVERFLSAVGTVGDRRRREQAAILARLDGLKANTNRDVIPKEAWASIVEPAMADASVTTRQLQARIGTAYCGSTLYRAGMSRDRALVVADAVTSTELGRLA
jgi:replicative DNA helicase